MWRHGFRLQKVLDAKRMFEDRRKQELAAAVRALARERQSLSTLDVERETFRRQALALVPGRLDVGREVAVRALIDRLVQEIRRQREAVAHCERRVVDRRALLVDSMVERKALENLRERVRERQRHDQDAREQVRTDEVARLVFRRGRRGGSGA